MINRALLRIKALQVLYSFYVNENDELKNAEVELQHSVKKAYDLYHLLLQLVVETTRYAELRQDVARHKLNRDSDEERLNDPLVENLFAKELRNNIELREYVESQTINWNSYDQVVKSLYDRIVSSDYYEAYLEKGSRDYNADKDLWIKILKKEILNNELLHDALEEMSIYWMDDMEIVHSFVIKTCKAFKQDALGQQRLLPMYRDEKDYEFVVRLIQNTILNSKEYTEIIDKHTKNWDFDRIALMDVIIMRMAIAELIGFPSIPVNVTLNEYIELAKWYSTPRSGYFVNGVLDKIVTELKKEGRLQKPSL